LYYNAMLAHAALGKLFDLPVVLSTSAQSGPNGPLPKAILDMYPDVPVVARQGEVDAWDNPEFRKAIEATGKKQVILAGITTDVCKSHPQKPAGHLDRMEESSDNIHRYDLLRSLAARKRLQRLGQRRSVRHHDRVHPRRV
jgi:nicotinamidase-related amidase